MPHEEQLPEVLAIEDGEPADEKEETISIDHSEGEAIVDGYESVSENEADNNGNFQADPPIALCSASPGTSRGSMSIASQPSREEVLQRMEAVKQELASRGVPTVDATVAGRGASLCVQGLVQIKNRRQHNNSQAGQVHHTSLVLYDPESGSNRTKLAPGTCRLFHRTVHGQP